MSACPRRLENTTVLNIELGRITTVISDRAIESPELQRWFIGVGATVASQKRTQMIPEVPFKLDSFLAALRERILKRGTRDCCMQTALIE